MQIGRQCAVQNLYPVRTVHHYQQWIQHRNPVLMVILQISLWHGLEGQGPMRSTVVEGTLLLVLALPVCVGS